jgi:hypothetical protein
VKAGGKLRIVRGRFATRDGSKIGENIVISGVFEATAREKEVTSLAGKLEIEQGEVLWDKFFGDLKAKRAAAEFTGDYVTVNDAVRLRRLNLSLAGIGNVDIAGHIQRVSNSPAVRLDITSDDIQPGGIFEFFVRDTLKRSYPIVDRLNVGGRMSLAVRAEGAPEDWMAEGNIRLQAGELREQSNRWQIGVVNLALPFRVRRPGATAAAPPQAPLGTLEIRSARIGSEPIAPLRTALSLWNNTLEFRQPIRVSVYGGTVELANLRWQDFLNDPKAFTFSLNARSLQLDKLTEELDWYRFGGTLTGSIPKIESTSNLLRSQGDVRIELFGGMLRIGQIEIENPFSPLLSVKLDARFHDIRLELASETFEFGRISGILDGSINDLVVTNGQPSQFMADVHTVQRHGTSQWISVEALNKITVLSSGNDAGVLYGGIAGFFDNFRYSKLGFKAALKNDKLTLRGIESRGGQEYLVVGTLLPPTVNVISHTQEISFGELVRRLEQIGKSGKPQIK